MSYARDVVAKSIASFLQRLNVELGELEGLGAASPRRYRQLATPLPLASVSPSLASQGSWKRYNTYCIMIIEPRTMIPSPHLDQFLILGFLAPERSLKFALELPETHR